MNSIPMERKAFIIQVAHKSFFYFGPLALSKHPSALQAPCYLMTLLGELMLHSPCKRRIVFTFTITLLLHQFIRHRRLWILLLRPPFWR